MTVARITPPTIHIDVGAGGGTSFDADLRWVCKAKPDGVLVAVSSLYTVLPPFTVNWHGWIITIVFSAAIPPGSSFDVTVECTYQ